MDLSYSIVETGQNQPLTSNGVTLTFDNTSGTMKIAIPTLVNLSSVVTEGAQFDFQIKVTDLNS